MQQLINAIRDRNVILFVGAGVSKHLGLPSYAELMDKLAVELGYDAEIFKTFGDYMLLAEYYHLEKGSLGALRSWMDRTWHPDTIDIGASEIHRLIVELNFPVIYTTNYDRWLEKAFEHYKRPFLKIANLADMTKSQTAGTHIVKFHGDFDEDESLVLTESSYLNRLNFESPLDVRLRSDAIGKAILFIGYSLSDINIRYLLFRLQKQWDIPEFKKLRPDSYIFLSRPNPIQECVLRDRGITVLESESENPSDGLKRFLSGLLLEASQKVV